MALAITSESTVKARAEHRSAGVSWRLQIASVLVRGLSRHESDCR
jgi:hypothetical protein